MTVGDWVRETIDDYQHHGPITGTRHVAKNTIESALSRIDPYIGGYHIYEEPWDVLIVIDACRYDLLNSVAADFEWLDSEGVESRQSVATATRTWMQRTFTSEYSGAMAKTAYIAGNPYSQPLLNASDFQTLDEVHQYAWDDEQGTLPARSVTERAIDIQRTGNHDRLLVHYLQPHFPSVPDPLGYQMTLERFENPEGGVEWDSVWDALEAGEVSTDRVWESYRANLSYVLNEIEVLLENLDADGVILTSDHGNAFGEWWTYGHPPGQYVPVNRTVPFVEVQATDEETLIPTLERANEENSPDEELEARLGALGYR